MAHRVLFLYFVLHMDFSSSSHDSTFTIRRTASDAILFLHYVDNMVITGDDLHGIQ